MSPWQASCRGHASIPESSPASGYVTLRAKKDNLLCRAGGEIAAHEFHHWDCTCPGDAFAAEKPTGRRWECAVASDTLYAGFPHFHFYSTWNFFTAFMTPV